MKKNSLIIILLGIIAFLLLLNLFAPDLIKTQNYFALVSLKPQIVEERKMEGRGPCPQNKPPWPAMCERGTTTKYFKILNRKVLELGTYPYEQKIY